jgi:hypothetical protein
MSIKVLTEPPTPRTVPSTWAVNEARLATTKVHDLLDEASARLARLAAEVELPEEVASAVRETLQLVEAGRETLGPARRAAAQRSPR